MGFGNLGFGELMVILVIVLVLFGARRVPEIGASIGKAFASSRRTSATLIVRCEIPFAMRDRRSASARRLTRTLARWRSRRGPSRSVYLGLADARMERAGSTWSPPFSRSYFASSG